MTTTLSASEDNTLAGRISRELAARIVSGTLAPGERLRQDHVAVEFGASHVPVREAFRRLEAQGLVASEPRRGVRVAGMDPQAVREITEMRAALESLALRHAVPRIVAADLQRAREALADSDASTDLRVWEQANHKFHLALLAPCGMQRLLASVEDLQAAASRILFAAWQTQNWQPRSDKEHRLILRAVEKGDGEDAAARLSAHILSAGEALVTSLKASRPAP
ncbi:MAG: GntR family transcriptional regulator [Pseudomonadota bacterium]